jgi:hypothetical protein
VAERSAYLKAIAVDRSLPIDPDAVALWLRDLDNPLRWSVRPLLQFLLAALLHVIWFVKRLPLPQFRAHGLLQRLICGFCTHFVSPEANRLLLRHFATESNVLNFLRDNTPGADRVAPLALYPRTIDELRVATFVDHDQELFRTMRELGEWEAPSSPTPSAALRWTHWRPIDLAPEPPRRRTQVVDFETAHALFMCLFCLLLTRDEYRDAINGFNLDQSIAICIGRIVGDPSFAELAYNKYPLYLVGPWNLTQRFLLHGFFTEHLHAALARVRERSAVS